MKHTPRDLWLGTVLVIIAVSLTGCSTGGGGGGGSGGGGGTGNINDNGGGNGGDGGGGGAGVVFGQVQAVGAGPLSGVAVTLSSGRSASTDDNGFFSFSGLTEGERMIASFRKTGYAGTTKALSVPDSDAAVVNRVVMTAAADPVTLNPMERSTARSGKSAVTIEAGSIVDANGNPVTGEVELTATFIDPSTGAVEAFPGSFEDAQAANGQAVTLESFGFAMYEVTAGGEPVNLGGGGTAEIEYELPDNAQELFQVGDTIPLWEFDEATATWVERGTGEVRQASDGSGRLAWFAIVDHFSAWNADLPLSDKECITGRVVSAGQPVAGADITAVGVSYNGTSSARTGSDGEFCVDVKNGSTVRIEVRLNGAASPLVVREVTVPATNASCATGGCIDIGDLSVSFDACVQGRVTDENGNPAAGVTVYVVPGETAVTDANGQFCAPAPANLSVYVFAEGRPSVSVTTGAEGLCGGQCAEANLTITLPDDGDVVGTLTAAKSVSKTTGMGSPGGIDSVDAFALNGAFLVAEADDLEGFTIEGMDIDTETVGQCTATTVTFVNTGAEPSFSFGGIGALDPGDPGRASHDTAGIDLHRGNPASFDPPMPFMAGLFNPDETSSELLAMGLDAGQTITFSFPGGADIGAFSGSVEVPADLNVTSPDLDDPNLVLDLNGDLDVVWDAGNSSDTVSVTVGGSTFDMSGGSLTSVSIMCEFPDTGSGTVPASLTARIPSDAQNTVISISRINQEDVSVRLNRTGGTGIVRLGGSVGVTRVFMAAFDMCDYITCPEGQVCNSLTGACE